MPVIPFERKILLLFTDVNVFLDLIQLLCLFLDQRELVGSFLVLPSPPCVGKVRNFLHSGWGREGNCGNINRSF